MDVPNERKVHTRPIPRFGGPAIYLGFTISVFLGLFFFNRSLLIHFPSTYYGIFLGQFIIFAIGVYDDIRGTNAFLKFGAQSLAAIVVIAAGGTIPFLTIPSVMDFTSQHSFSVPIMGTLSWLLPFLWIVGITNAFNLIDGMDGLAAGLAFIAAGTLFFAGFNIGNLVGCMMYICIAGATLAFLRFNYYPAKIFMGDSGSMFLGFTLACLSLVGRQKSATAAILLTPIVVMGIPLFDTLLAIVRRVLERRPVFKADKKHVHHSLLARGLHHKNVVNSIYAAAVFLSFVSIVIMNANDDFAAFIVVVVSLTVGVMAQKIGLININLLRAKRDYILENQPASPDDRVSSEGIAGEDKDRSVTQGARP